MTIRKGPFRADHVGSLLRPKAIHDARAQKAKGEITAEQLKEIEDREIERVIRKQEEVGLQSITDGEFRRSWWHLDFLWGLGGIEKYVADEGLQFSGMKVRPEYAHVTSKLSYRGHAMIEHFKFLKDHTSRTAKMTIPSPSALYGRTGRASVTEEAYPSLDVFFKELGETYGKAVRDFAEDRKSVV